MIERQILRFTVYGSSFAELNSDHALTGRPGGQIENVSVTGDVVAACVGQKRFSNAVRLASAIIVALEHGIAVKKET
jgi:hypothetical protein